MSERFLFLAFRRVCVLCALSVCAPIVPFFSTTPYNKPPGRSDRALPDTMDDLEEVMSELGPRRADAAAEKKKIRRLSGEHGRIGHAGRQERLAQQAPHAAAQHRSPR